ncbi:MAG: hypothetical protein ACFCGT_17925 [Sandaracinaceae bacterium]
MTSRASASPLLLCALLLGAGVLAACGESDPGDPDEGFQFPDLGSADLGGPDLGPPDEGPLDEGVPPDGSITDGGGVPAFQSDLTIFLTTSSLVRSLPAVTAEMSQLGFTAMGVYDIDASLDGPELIGLVGADVYVQIDRSATRIVFEERGTLTLGGEDFAPSALVAGRLDPNGFEPMLLAVQGSEAYVVDPTDLTADGPIDLRREGLPFLPRSLTRNRFRSTPDPLLALDEQSSTLYWFSRFDGEFRPVLAPVLGEPDPQPVDPRVCGEDEVITASSMFSAYIDAAAGPLFEQTNLVLISGSDAYVLEQNEVRTCFSEPLDLRNASSMPIEPAFGTGYDLDDDGLPDAIFVVQRQL